MIPHLVDDLESAIERERSQDFSRAAVPKELLVQASVPALLRMALTEWAVIGLCWMGLWLLPVYAAPVWVLLIGARIHALGVVLHDAAHLPLRSHGPLVRVLEVLAGFPLATTLAAMRYHHVRHHRDTCMPSDPYFKGQLKGRPVKTALNVLRGIALVPFWSVRCWVGLIASVVPSWRNVYGRVFLQDRSGKDLRESSEVVACGRAELGQLVFQLAVIALAVRFPLQVLVGYALPAVVAGLLAAWRLIKEHTDVPVTDRSTPTIVAVTKDDVPGWLGRFLLTPRNIGHHIVHHLHPQVSLSALPRLRQWYLDNAPGYPR